MNEQTFGALLLENITSQWKRFPYYKHLCDGQGISLPDLKAFVEAQEYHRVPSVLSSAFKLSKGLLLDLNDLSVPGIMQVSSSTSGDASFVHTSNAEAGVIRESYRRTFGIPGVDLAIGFAPSLRILRALSKKSYSKGAAALRMLLALEGSVSHYKEFYISLDVDLLRTVLNKAIHRPAAIRKMRVEMIRNIIAGAESSKRPLTIGGVALLLRPYLDELGDGAFNLHDLMYVVFSGGGYSGIKGSIRGAKIDKPEFMEKIARVMGIDRQFWPLRFKDIYGFTETPALFEGFWNIEAEDFVFRPGPDARLYIVDPETEAPLRQGRGLLKIIAPSYSGNPAAANVCVLQSDAADIVSAREDGSVEAITRIARFEGASVEGCAFKAAELGGL